MPMLSPTAIVRGIVSYSCLSSDEPQCQDRAHVEIPSTREDVPGNPSGLYRIGKAKKKRKT